MIFRRVVKDRALQRYSEDASERDTMLKSKPRSEAVDTPLRLVDADRTRRRLTIIE